MKSKTLFCLFLLTLLTSLIPAMHAQTFSVIHSFTGTGSEGSSPVAGVTIRGNTLYGATSSSHPCNTVYQLTNTGSNWLFSTIAELPNNCDPRARVVFGPDSHLYGTSSAGGPAGGGTVFKLTPPAGPCRNAACYWAVSDLHDFDSNTDGYQPGTGDLIWDQQGNIYGTTEYGVASLGGTVYELTPSGNGYTESILYNFSDFDGLDGGLPVGGLVSDKNGNLFGTTLQGGANNLGVIFELTNVPGVGWTEKVLYNFQGTGDGEYPVAGLIFDSAGNLYGATGGACCTSGGSVFELSPVGDSWVFTALYSFPAGDYLGGGVVFGPDGALYSAFYSESDQTGGAFSS